MNTGIFFVVDRVFLHKSWE